RDKERRRGAGCGSGGRRRRDARAPLGRGGGAQPRLPRGEAAEDGPSGGEREGMSLDATVRDALKGVHYPDLAKDVLTTGIVRKVAADGADVAIDVVLPTMVV